MIDIVSIHYLLFKCFAPFNFIITYAMHSLKLYGYTLLKELSFLFDYFLIWGKGFKTIWFYIFLQIGRYQSVKGCLDRIFFDRLTIYQSTIIGVLLIIIGVIFLFNPINLHLKVSASIILIGFLVILLSDINEKYIPKTITGRQLIAIIAIWIFIIFIMTSHLESDIFFVLVLMGILIIKEFLNVFFSTSLKKRMKVVFYFLVFSFSVIIIQKVINIIVL